VSWMSGEPGRLPDMAERVEADRKATIATVLPPLGLEELCFLMVAAGLLCVTLWLASPALIWSVTAGSALLAIGLIGLVALPVDAAAVMLFAFATGLICMEVLAFPGGGLHAVGTGVSLTLAGLFLTESGPVRIRSLLSLPPLSWRQPPTGRVGAPGDASATGRSIRACN